MWRRWVRVVAWSLDLCDAHEAPSLSKGIAAAAAVVALRDAWVRGFSVLNVSALALAVSAAFGRSVFMNWLNRNQWQATTNTTVTVDAAKVAEVLARRDHERGVEPA